MLDQGPSSCSLEGLIKRDKYETYILASGRAECHLPFWAALADDMRTTTDIRIVLCYPIKDKHIEQIRSVLSELNVQGEIVDAGQERIAEEILQADFYCGHAKVPVPWDKVVHQGRLQWIQSSAAGMDHCLTPEVIASEQIMVTSASGLLANQVADHTFALMMGLLRSLPVFFRAQQKKEFIRRPTRDLHGARVGIVGFGGNGRKLAEVLRPFEVEIHATDYFPQDKPDYVTSLLPADQIDQLLPQIDILILAAPLNDQTVGMIDAKRLALLPDNSFLVNMARGPLVVEDDLVNALKSGKLAGAGLDVTEKEPLPETSELWELPNVIITPHVGGQVACRAEDVTDFFCGNLRRVLNDELPLNYLENKKLGFPKPHHSAWQFKIENYRSN